MNFNKNSLRDELRGQKLRGRFSVKDEGTGILPANVKPLFERYFHVENHSMTSISGFNKGLYLCSEIIQRHDGQIVVESELVKGSTFWFALPPAK